MIEIFRDRQIYKKKTKTNISMQRQGYWGKDKENTNTNIDMVYRCAWNV